MLLRKKPVLCNYYVTYRCNAKCSFCDIWEKPSPYVTIENVKKNLTDLKKLSVKIIDFTGGEPLLHQQLHQFLKIAKELNFITTVTTNCLLYPKRAEELRGLIDMLHFSLDSPYADEHNESRGVNCFSHFERSIDIAKSLGEKPDIIFTVTEKNISQIEEVYQKFCVPNNFILILNPMFSYNEVGKNLDENHLDTLLKWGKEPLVYMNKGFISLRKNGGNHTANPVCKAATTTIVISPENKMIMPCYHLALEEISIENNLYNLRKSETVQQQIYMEGKHEKCEGCVINCYMQPSMAVNLNNYWFDALPSTLKYNRLKGTWKKIFN